jgi:hypothetical protein
MMRTRTIGACRLQAVARELGVEAWSQSLCTVFGRLRGRLYSFMHGLFGMDELGQSLYLIHFSER